MERRNIDSIIEMIERESLPNLDQTYSSDVVNITSEIRKRVIYVCGNDFFYFENGSLAFQTTCVTGKNGFGVENESFKTPTGLHLVSEMIGDGSDKYQKFKNRIPTQIVAPVKHGELRPGVYARILRLDGIEKDNKNTASRGIYIHGNIHDWYWDTGNLRRSEGCIGLKLDEMIKLFDMIKHYKKRIFVFIKEK